MNKISQRQLFFLLGCVAPVGKLVILPARLAANAGGDLWIPALFHVLVQSAVIFCVLLLAKRGKSFYELLADTFGQIIAKILSVLFALFLLYAALLPLLEQQIFVQGVFYDTLPSLAAFSPFFLFSAYLCAKPLASFGRVWDILGPMAIVSFAGILVFSATNADYLAVLPVGSAGLKGIAGSTALSFSWFFDSALLIPLLGKIEYKRGAAWKGTLCYLAGGFAVLLFLVTFFGIFEGTAGNQLFAFTKTSKYYSAITALGRIDYVFIFALALVMAFYSALPLQGSIDCVLQAFGKKRYLPTLLSIGVNLLFFGFTVFFDFRFNLAMEFISQKLFWIFPVFTVLLPPLCLLLRRKRHESA